MLPGPIKHMMNDGMRTTLGMKLKLNNNLTDHDLNMLSSVLQGSFISKRSYDLNIFGKSDRHKIKSFCGLLANYLQMKITSNENYEQKKFMFVDDFYQYKELF